MKTLRLFLLALLVTASIMVSAVPIIAATQNPTHPSPLHLQDGNPTATPTRPGDPPDDCMSSGC